MNFNDNKQCHKVLHKQKRILLFIKISEISKLFIIHNSLFLGLKKCFKIISLKFSQIFQDTILFSILNSQITELIGTDR